MEISRFKNPNSISSSYYVDIKDIELEAIGESIQNEVIRKLSDKITDHIMQNQLSEILEYVSPQAIANLALAKAASGILEILKDKT